MQELESDDETINDGLLYEEDDFLLSPVPGSAVRSHSMELPLAGEEISEKSLELKSKTSSPKRRGSLGGSDHSSRSKSPSTWRTHSPGTRRALKKSLMFGGDGNDIGGSSDSRRSCSSSHLRERLLNGNNGSSHSRRGNSHHGSSHFRDRQTNNSTTGLESSLRGSSHIREKLLGPGNGDNAVNIGSSNCRVRSRNMIQTAKEASSGSTLENENDQLIGSDHSLPNQLITTGPRISWKSDAKASFCDWRIEVCHVNGDPADAKDVYNIHRNIVGFGPRKSNFMCKQFIKQIEERNYVAGSNVTQINLPHWQADAFPMVLDFIYYTKEMKQALTAERACSVFQIAQILEIRPLEDAINNFYKKTLTLKNMTDFLASASRTNTGRLLFTARAKLGSLVMEKPELSGLVSPELMVDLLRVNKEQVKQMRARTPERYPEKLRILQSRTWSRAVFVCATHNVKHMTKEIFDSMTDEECLPAIDHSVAFKLLMLDAKYDRNVTEYRSLQKRCVQSISDNWEAFTEGFNSTEKCNREIQKLPSLVRNNILAKSSRQLL